MNCSGESPIKGFVQSINGTVNNCLPAAHQLPLAQPAFVLIQRFDFIPLAGLLPPYQAISTLDFDHPYIELHRATPSPYCK